MSEVQRPLPRTKHNAPDKSSSCELDLLARRPPGEGPWPGEDLLWWAVLRRAALDAAHGSWSVALEAAGFLRDFGVVIAGKLWGVPRGVVVRGVLQLMKPRYKS